LVLLPTVETTIATTITPISAVMIGQCRSLRVSIVLAPAEPEMVEGSERWAGPGSTATRGGSVRTMHLVRCTEMAACISDCAYFDIACASSAML